MRLLLSGVCSASIGLLSSLALSQTPVPPNVTDDPVVSTHLAHASLDFRNNDFEKLLGNLGRPLDCATKGNLLDKLMVTVESGNAAHTAYVFHVAKWRPSVPGTYQLSDDKWIAYRRVGTGKACSLVPTGSKQTITNDPLLYGRSNIIFVGVNLFTGNPDLKGITLTYDVSATADTSDTIQDLGALLYALLGATVPATAGSQAGGGGGGEEPNVLVATAKIANPPRLPFFTNFTLSAAMTQPGTLPDGEVGVPYSGTVAATGGTGTYIYSTNKLPPGLFLDPQTGAISGTPTTAGSAPFTIQVTDNSRHGNRQSIGATIKIRASLGVTLTAASATVTTPPVAATVGVPYISAIVVSGGTAPYTYSASGLPTWLSFNPTTGILSGLPDKVGNSSFSLTIKDAANGAVAQNVMVNLRTMGSIVPDAVPVTAAVHHRTDGQPLSVQVIPTLPADPNIPGSVATQMPGSDFECPECSLYGLTVTLSGKISGDPTATGVISILAVIDGRKQALPIKIDQNPYTVDPTLPLKIQPVVISHLDSVELGPVLGVPFVGQIKFSGDQNAKYIYACPQCSNGALKGLGISPADGTFTNSPSGTGSSFTTIAATSAGQSFAVPLEIKVFDPQLALSFTAAGGTQPAAQTAAPANTGGGKGGGGGGGKGGGGGGGTGSGQAVTPASTASTTTSTSQAVKCAISSGSPCSFSRTLRSDDREFLDFGIGVAAIGAKERVYTSPTAFTITTHADAYAFADLYPFFPISPKTGYPPHLIAGLPVTGSTFHRPLFGIAENLTSWTGLERLGLPRISVFGGIVYMQQKLPNPSGVLVTDRAIKQVWGVELSITSLVSKIGSAAKGSSSKSSSSKSASGS